jgi:leucyl-tRNA synthetase
VKRYNPSEIEPKWQQLWDERQTYKADLTSDKPKYIAMSMFNYPSGAGIHIGHAMNYTISDVMARFRRQQGFESYHPVGWDAFGLPAENFAIKSGISPQESMAKIIPDYHKQYKAMGWSNDWSKEIATHEPGYYKWTQWLFAQMYKNGLAYQDSRLQWWCDKCQTVLANEQIIDGKCWRHDSAEDPEVSKREAKQWFFKVTEYADELLEATDALDWTESVKTAQKNWIGKSVGAEVKFEIPDTDDSITVFTTRPDTMFGATFMVLAPEHDLVEKISTDDCREAVAAYVKEISKKTEVERQSAKEKTGMFTGAYVINPANGQKIPIWVADYVLAGYGTGAVMAVPAHDERDFEFAEKYDLSIVAVVEKPENEHEPGPYHGEGVLVNSDVFDGTRSEDAREQVVAWLEEQNVGEGKTIYKIRDWSVSRQRYWGAPIPIVNCVKCGPVLVPENQLPVVLPELDDYAPSGDGRSALARATDWVKTDCPECGGQAERETDTLDTYICSSWYMLRYFDPANEDQIFDTDVANKWTPIDFYNGGDHATAHMIYARFVTRFLHKLGLLENPEPFKKFLYNGKVTAASGEMFSKRLGNGVDPLEIINQGYGADALRTYMMFAAPLEVWMKWNTKGVPGTYRFLSRVWNLTQDFLDAEATEGNIENVLKTIHPVILKVTKDIEDQKYNTAIAALMEVTNDLYSLKTKGFGDKTDWRFAVESLVMMVAPFAPHMAEELWQDLDHETSVNVDNWPKWDEKYLEQDTVTIAVQVNGKLRGEIEVAADASEEEVKSAALAQENVAKHLDNKKPTKVIYVPGRLVNVVA